MAKTKKLEQYGPKSMPLVRSTWMSDAQWASAKVEFDAAMRRMGKKVTWAAKAPHRCPACGTEAGPFGAASGMCFPCSDRAVDNLLGDVVKGRRGRRG